MKHILLFQCILALFLFLYPTKEGISQRPIVREQREDGTWGPLQAPTYTGTDGRPYILNKGDPDFKTYDRWVRFYQYQAIPPHVWQQIKRDYLSTFLLNNQPVSGGNKIKTFPIPTPFFFFFFFLKVLTFFFPQAIGC